MSSPPDSGDAIPGPLSEAQVQRFAVDGYLVAPDVIDLAELDALLCGADWLIELIIDSSVVLGRRNPRADILHDPGGGLVIRRISPVVDVLPAARAVSVRVELVSAVAQLLGSGSPQLFESKLNYKQRVETVAAMPFIPTRGSSDQWPLHHDWGYFRQQGYPEEVVTVAISLDDATGRGPMLVVPGSHRAPVRMVAADPESGTGRVYEETVGQCRQPIEAPPRSALFFHSKLVHCSPPNPSDQPRRILHLSYAPPFADDSASARRNGRWVAAARRFEHRYRAGTADDPRQRELAG